MSVSDKGFAIKRMHLHSPNLSTPQSLEGLFTSLSINLDMRVPFINGTITIYDAQGYSELFPILGEELLELEIETKNGRTNKIDSFKGLFRIYGTTPQERNSTGVGAAYSLKFVSIEYFINRRIKIYQSFLKRDNLNSPTSLPLSEIVKLVYNQHIKQQMLELYPDFTKDIETEQTLRNYQIIFPNMNPYSAILMSARRAISADRLNNKGATYIFFEDFDKFKFVSLESLMAVQPVRTYNLVPTALMESSASLDPINLIDDFKVLKTFDVRDNIDEGMYSSKLITYDFERMLVRKFDYEYVPQLDMITQEVVIDGVKRKVVKKSITDPNTDTLIDRSKAISPLGKLCTQNNDNLNHPFQSVHLVSSNMSHDIAFEKNLKEQGGYKEKGIEPKQIEEYFLQRHSQLQQLENIKVGVTLKKSDSTLKLGDMIELNIPSETIAENKNPNVPPANHFFYGGKYIISKISHTISMSEDSLVTSLELSKNSLDNPMPDFKPDVLQQEDIFNSDFTSDGTPRVTGQEYYE